APFPSLRLWYRNGRGSWYRNRASGPILAVLGNANCAVSAPASLSACVQLPEGRRRLAAGKIRNPGRFILRQNSRDHPAVVGYPDFTMPRSFAHQLAGPVVKFSNG